MFDPHGAANTAPAISYTPISHPVVCIFDQFCFYIASVSIPSCAVYSTTVIRHASVHTEAVVHLSLQARVYSACHMRMHMCAHLLKAAGTLSIGLFLCRNDLFLDHSGLFLLAGLQPLSAAHRL